MQQFSNWIPKQTSTLSLVSTMMVHQTPVNTSVRISADTHHWGRRPCNCWSTTPSLEKEFWGKNHSSTIHELADWMQTRTDTDTLTFSDLIKPSDPGTIETNRWKNRQRLIKHPNLTCLEDEEFVVSQGHNISLINQKKLSHAIFKWSGKFLQFLIKRN